MRPTLLSAPAHAGPSRLPRPTSSAPHRRWVELRSTSTTGTRAFGCSSRVRASVRGHYDVLRLPKNASKQQIKARFYELSKKYHPDAPGGDASKFHEINDAYAVLHDESKRRSYDTSLAPAASTSFHPHSPLSRSSPSGPHRAWRRAAPAGQHHSADFNRRHQAGAGAGTAHYPRSTVFGRKRDTESARAAREAEAESRSGESVLWRFGVVVGLLMAVISFGGGLTASADEGRPPEASGDGEGRTR